MYFVTRSSATRSSTSSVGFVFLSDVLSASSGCVHMSSTTDQLPAPTSGLPLEITFRRLLRSCQQIIVGDTKGRDDLRDWRTSPIFHHVSEAGNRPLKQIILHILTMIFVLALACVRRASVVCGDAARPAGRPGNAGGVQASIACMMHLPSSTKANFKFLCQHTHTLKFIGYMQAG